MCVSDRVKVCACECPGVRESEPGATPVGAGRICFAAGPSRALAAAATPAASCQFCPPALTSVQADAARRRCVGGFWLCRCWRLSRRGTLFLPRRGTLTALTLALHVVPRPRDPDPGLARQPHNALGWEHSLRGCSN